MKLPKDITVGGQNFAIYHTPVRQVLSLQRLLLRIMSPLLGGLGSIISGIDVKDLMKDGATNEDAGKVLLGALSSGNVSLDRLGYSLQNALGALSEAEYEVFLTGMLDRVQWKASREEGGAQFLNNFEAIDKAFSDNPNGVYVVIFEVIKYNKFLPFALTGTGSAT